VESIRHDVEGLILLLVCGKFIADDHWKVLWHQNPTPNSYCTLSLGRVR